MGAGYEGPLVSQPHAIVRIDQHDVQTSLTKCRFKKSGPSDFWVNVKPSHLGASKPAWMDFDDEWVDEVRRGLLACKVFLWYPLYCM